MSAIAQRTPSIQTGRGVLAGRVSDFLWKHPTRAFSPCCSAPPLLWLGIIYLGSLLALLLQSFFSIDDFSGLINYEFTLATYRQLLNDANFDIIIRTMLMAAIGDAVFRGDRLPDRLLRGPLCQGEMEGALLSRRHAAALVELSRQDLRLETDPRQGRHPHLALRPSSTCSGCSMAWLSLPVIGGNSLSVSYTGTFIVFVYVWMPFMILPIQAALERVPGQPDRGVVRSRRHAAPDFPPLCCFPLRFPASSPARSSPFR